MESSNPSHDTAATDAREGPKTPRDPDQGYPLLVIARQLVGHDLLVQLTAAVFLASLLPSLLPFFDQAQRGSINNNTFRILQLMAFCALRVDIRKLDRLERTFWNDLSLVYGCWLMVTALYALSPRPTGEHSLTFYLSVEVLLALGYGAWVLAAERQPHRRHRLRAVGLEHSLSWPAATAFVGGLLLYFILLPAFLDRSEYESFLPSMLLYSSLDAYLMVRFFSLSRDTGDPRWRLIYGGLALTAAGMLIGDLLETAIDQLPGLDWGSPLDSLYDIQLLALVFTARLRHFEPPPNVRHHPPSTFYGDWRMGPTLPTLITALVIPILHFACYSAGLLEESLEKIRQVLVVGWIGVLGFIAAVQHALLSKRAQQLWRDWRRAEKALRRSEQKARVMAERSRTREALRQTEESFRLALQATPSPLAILTRSDGRFREMNQAFLELTGYRRRELMGRTPAELHLWHRPRDAARMRQELREKPTTLLREIVLRTRCGDLLRIRLTADHLLFQGTPSLIVTLREPPPEMQWLADLAAGKPWLAELAAEVEPAGQEGGTVAKTREETAAEESGEEGDTSTLTVFDETDRPWRITWSTRPADPGSSS